VECEWIAFSLKPLSVSSPADLSLASEEREAIILRHNKTLSFTGHGFSIKQIVRNRYSKWLPAQFIL